MKTRSTAFSLIVGWLVVLSVSALAAEQPLRPNIILVMADDLGWSDIGCYGGEIRTPQIDSLARDGLRFTQFYNNAICGPTRASLLTGLYCQQVGHRGDRWNEAKDFNKCVTIGEVLQTAGYHTMMVGKWQGRDSALDRGFDRFFGPYDGGEMITKPLSFSGNRLTINYASSAVGGLRVEVQTPDGKPVNGFAMGDCAEIIGDRIEHTVSWKRGADVSTLVGKPIRLRFVLKDADLYALQFTTKE